MTKLAIDYEWHGEKAAPELGTKAEVKRTAMMEQIQYDVFEAMHFSVEDHKLLDAILEGGSHRPGRAGSAGPILG